MIIVLGYVLRQRKDVAIMLRSAIRFSGSGGLVSAYRDTVAATIVVLHT